MTPEQKHAFILAIFAFGNVCFIAGEVSRKTREIRDSWTLRRIDIWYAGWFTLAFFVSLITFNYFK